MVSVVCLYWCNMWCLYKKFNVSLYWIFYRTPCRNFLWKQFDFPWKNLQLSTKAATGDIKMLLLTWKIGKANKVLNFSVYMVNKIPAIFQTWCPVHGQNSSMPICLLCFLLRTVRNEGSRYEIGSKLLYIWLLLTDTWTLGMRWPTSSHGGRCSPLFKIIEKTLGINFMLLCNFPLIDHRIC